MSDHVTSFHGQRSDVQRTNSVGIGRNDIRVGQRDSVNNIKVASVRTKHQEVEINRCAVRVVADLQRRNAAVAGDGFKVIVDEQEIGRVHIADVGYRRQVGPDRFRR